MNIPRWVAVPGPFCCLTPHENPHGIAATAVDVVVSSAGHVAFIRLAIQVNIALIVSAPALITVLQTVVVVVLADGGAALSHRSHSKEGSNEIRP